MKSIARRDNGDDWKAYLTRLAAEDGVEIKSQAELIRYDKQRNKDGQKKVSNDDWTSPADPDARIAKMKDGTTHLSVQTLWNGLSFSGMYGVMPSIPSSSQRARVSAL